MKVKDLIKKLQTFAEDKEVYVIWDDENPTQGGSEIKDLFEIHGSNNDINNAVYIVKE